LNCRIFRNNLKCGWRLATGDWQQAASSKQHQFKNKQYEHN
jgi:hypothetical protein